MSKPIPKLIDWASVGPNFDVFRVHLGNDLGDLCAECRAVAVRYCAHNAIRRSRTSLPSTSNLGRQSIPIDLAYVVSTVGVPIG